MTDLYSVLGVSEDASADDIKRAFRQLARKWHPDANGGSAEAAERYKEISEAYSVLSDPQKRREYDARRAGAGGWSPFATSVEDIFDAFFGGGPGRGTGRQRTRARRGDAIEVACRVEFREVVFGGDRTIRFQRFDPCGTCEGSGCAPGTSPQRCERCDGSGQVQQVRRTILGSLVTAYPCVVCGESGWVVPDPCSDCEGSGRRLSHQEMEISVPPGVETGDRLRIREEGEAGPASGARGDLYVRFEVEADERFARAGNDLVTWADIPMTAAALGGRVVFESLDGTETLDVPPGTQSGERFRVRGRGLVHGRGRGDLIVGVRVETPTGLDDEQEELLRRLAELRGEEAGEGLTIGGRLRRALGLD